MLGGCGTRGKRQKEATCGRNEAQKSTFFFSSRRQQTRYWRDWSSDVCSSDLRSRRCFLHPAMTVVLDRRGAVVRVLDPWLYAAHSGGQDSRTCMPAHHLAARLSPPSTPLAGC